MNAAQIFLYLALGAAGIAFVIGAMRAAPRRKDRRPPSPLEILVGFVTDFFDTLGIGSFAPTTAIYKLRRMVPDERIPGTLNVGHTPSAITEALIFVGTILVDPALLVTMILSATAGAWHWVALTYDGKTLTTYVDGVKDLAGEVALQPIGSGKMSLGVRLNRVDWFKGGIAELRATPRALAPAELAR